MHAKFVLSALVLASTSTFAAADNNFLNVYGDSLQPCSSDGMALTGYTRTGYCVDQYDDTGSHHICIDLSSANGGNFCDVTGQDDWCDSEMPCDGDSDSYCQVQQWCVCQWAFASYLSNAGGCDMIQDIVCESINVQAVWAYQGNSKYNDALNCLVDRCGLDMSNTSLYLSHQKRATTRVVLFAAAALLAVVLGVVVWRNRSPKKDVLLPKPEGSYGTESLSPTGKIV